MEVLIIGAGTTGLLLAQGLKQAGIKATIYERETPERYRTRPREWGMTLHWGSEAIAKVLPLELRRRMGEVRCDPRYEVPEDQVLHTYSGDTGEVLMSMPAPGAVSVSRRKMRSLFSEGLSIVYGKSLTSIEHSEGGVTAVFQDGDRKNANLIVGCDGAHSVVRSLLIGEEAARVTDIHISMFNFPTTFDADTARLIRSKHPIFFNSVHPKGWMYMFRIQDVPEPDGPASWSFQNLLSWRGPPHVEELATQEQRTAWLKGLASEYAEPWRSTLTNMPDDVRFGVDRLSLWKPFDWSACPLAGRVTLAGDAAHNMPPHRAQGLNNGLEDAALLTEQLSKVSGTLEGLQEAVRGYEEEMVPRGVRDVELSEQSAYMHHDYDRVLESPLAKMGLKKARAEDVKG